MAARNPPNQPSTPNPSSARDLNIIDSSGWLEVLADGPHATPFIDVIAVGNLIVPAITVFEVNKRARLLLSETDAQRVESHMRRFPIIDTTADRASAAARCSLQYKLPMADSLISRVRHQTRFPREFPLHRSMKSTT